jgi:hypothetical protein
MFWKERNGKFCPDAGCSAQAFQVDTQSASLLATLKGVTEFKLHRFNAAIDLATSISHFWFEVDNNDGSAPFVVDNHGANYSIDQDVVMYDPRRTSATIAGLIMVAAVRHLSLFNKSFCSNLFFSASGQGSLWNRNRVCHHHDLWNH